MPRIGYHASHEQINPTDLLRYLRLAESAGFQCGMCSDHYFPWTDRQGESGFAWSWLGSALEATALSIGVVTVPGGWRYHPAVMAQAAATLASMYPERFWLAAGSGEALNEHITGERWPHKEERNARLREGVEIMRALWAGETVTHRGLITIEEAKLYTRPSNPPLVYGAALSAETARWMGGWCDGLISTVSELGAMRRIVEAFREGGGEGKPIALQAQLSYAGSDEEAVDAAWDQWRAVGFGSSVLALLRMPAEFEAASFSIDRETVRAKIRCSGSVEQHLEWLHEYLTLGYSDIYLHNVNRAEQERFIEDFGAQVLPRIAEGF